MEHNPDEVPHDLPVPVDDGSAAHLVGTAMPHLTMISTAGDGVDLSGPGSGRILLCLYPRTGRPGVPPPVGWNMFPGARGCTPELRGLEDAYGLLMSTGVNKLYGLSSQGIDYQKEAVRRLGLPFSLLSDEKFVLRDALGLPVFRIGSNTYYKRLTLVVMHGSIEHVFYPVFPPDEHASEILKWLTVRLGG